MMQPSLKINLAHLKNNYQLLQAKNNCGAVVKANAYGIGINEAVKALHQAGCREFFVAYTAEGIAIRKLLSDVKIFVFAGIDDTAKQVEYDLIPVLNDDYQLNSWNMNLPFAVHIDTGITRLGFAYDDLPNILKDNKNIALIMSHLACADEPNHEMNKFQLERFRKLRDLFPNHRLSLANSSGVFLGEDYHFDLLRPGCALYGINPSPYAENPMKCVANLSAKLIQVRKLSNDAYIGYGATRKMKAGQTIGVFSIGYADGLFRYAAEKRYMFFAGQKCEIVGRVSMDMITVDISSCGGYSLHDEGEIFGENISVDAYAAASGTIGYEALTGIGERAKRIYSSVG